MEDSDCVTNLPFLMLFCFLLFLTTINPTMQMKIIQNPNMLPAMEITKIANGTESVVALNVAFTEVVILTEGVIDVLFIVA